MNREQAIDVLINRYNSGVIRGRIDDDEWRLATETAIAALRGHEWSGLRTGCPACDWIDITRAHEDEDGPINYCRVCGRYLRNPGEAGTKIDHHLRQ